MKVELVCVPLPMHLLHDVLVVIIPQGPAHLVIVHVRLGLPFPPPPGNLVRVGHLELAGGALPGDVGGSGGIGQELEEELPELDLTGGLDWGWGGGWVAADFCNS